MVKGAVEICARRIRVHIYKLVGTEYLQNFFKLGLIHASAFSRLQTTGSIKVCCPS